MEKNIREYARQFAYEPEVKNADKLGEFETVVIGGMGGSGLVAGVLRAIKPSLDVAVHHEYGLPQFADKDKEKRLFIAISHSGNTEEVVDFMNTAVSQGLQTAVVASHGKLLELAQQNGLPHITLPADDIQPRMALGYMLRAVLKLIKEEDLFSETGKLTDNLKPTELEPHGRRLAEAVINRIPIIYASRSNQILAYNWKIRFNETAKVPAFFNTFPELNHNEIQGFGTHEGSQVLSEKMSFIFLEDDSDHQRIKRRMDITAAMYKKFGLPVERIGLEGGTRLEKIFNTIILGDWTAYHAALKYGAELESVPGIDEFKRALGA
ncbi:MAG: bifunctional phosphoglucose/phosphomannose isomerase [Candidatus Colwellbacteria bacterium]|nr:bifunctional phosphoglucose/phosphomannose isomerase [Candidatus Colwellbacteria bacterium]